MNFEIDYNKLLDFAKHTIYKQKLNIDPSDLVNDAYIQFIESGDRYLIGKIKVLIIENGRADKNLEIKKNHNGEFTRAPERVCSRCKNSLPAGMFGITQNNHVGRRTIQWYCRDCQVMYFKNYFEEKRIEWNAKMKERYKQDKDQLNDRHIKKILRASGWAVKDITENVIKAQRRLVLEKKPYGQKILRPSVPS